MRIEDTHHNETRGAFTGQLILPNYNSTIYGLKSIYKRCIDSWNLMTKKIREDFEVKELAKNEPGRKSRRISFDLQDFTRIKLKKIITDDFISSYIIL